eukprot:5244854-Pyramimonas_sp.AAC.1
MRGSEVHGALRQSFGGATPVQRCRGRFHRAPRVVTDALAGVVCEVSSARRIVPGGRLASLPGFGRLQ